MSPFVRRSILSYQDRQRLLVVLDAGLGVGLLMLWLALRFGPRLWRPGFTWRWILLFWAVWFFVGFMLDLYDISSFNNRRAFLRRTALVAILAPALYLAIPYLPPPLPKGRFFILVLIALCLVGFTVAHFLFFQIVAPLRHRVLVLGLDPLARLVARTLRTYGHQLYQVVGFLALEPREGEARTQDERVDDLPVLGSISQLSEVIQKHGISALVTSVSPLMPVGLVQQVLDIVEQGVEILPAVVLYEQMTGKVPLEYVQDAWYVALPVRPPLLRPINRFIKRAMDIVLALLGLLFFLPLLPFLALAIYLDSPGPIFYQQERVGRGGKVFKVYKLRSMVPDAEKEGRPVWARENDPRVTRVGRFLRKTHLDEFPQLFNILKGEMSAVGPRPERPEFVEELAREIPFYRLRHVAKPGMAGWALIKYGYAASKEDAKEKLKYDLYYIKHWSPWLDLLILGKTVLDAVTLRGR